MPDIVPTYRAEQVRAVLTNAVRYTVPDAAVTADVLDAARRLVRCHGHLERNRLRAHDAGSEDERRFGRLGQLLRALHEPAGDAPDDRCRSVEWDVGEAFSFRCELDERKRVPAGCAVQTVGGAGETAELGDCQKGADFVDIH